MNLTEQMMTYINYIVEHQLPDGWLGPDDMDTDNNQVRVIFVLFCRKVFYCAAHDIL